MMLDFSQSVLGVSCFILISGTFRFSEGKFLARGNVCGVECMAIQYISCFIFHIGLKDSFLLFDHFARCC